ncbi:hypothetical protein RO07_23345 [Pandoraea pulmonicola]|uniref:Uncharacterized protein n=1 Tax=Pandoraea pulmonicola TaxID=93221 RepID=A0ABN4EXD0_PANPU|nr:hypothetical protein RO07_23345 [Pandoraea pulmonicola]
MSRRGSEVQWGDDGSADDSDSGSALGICTEGAEVTNGSNGTVGVAGADCVEDRADGADGTDGVNEADRSGGVGATAGARSATASILPCRPSLGKCGCASDLMRHRARAA